MTAEAATVAGLARCVRVIGPCRFLKLRFVELMTRMFDQIGPSLPAQLEQPDLRHSNPAALNMLSNPSASAWARTAIEPGVHIA